MQLTPVCLISYLPRRRLSLSGAPAFDEGHTTVLSFAPSAARRHRPLTVLCTLVDTPPTAGSNDGLSHDLSRVKDYVEGCIERCDVVAERMNAHGLGLTLRLRSPVLESRRFVLVPSNTAHGVRSWTIAELMRAL